MRFRRAAPTALIVTIVAVVATMTFVANRLFSGLTVAVEEGQYALMRSSVEASLRDEESRAVARAEIVAAIPAIRSAFAARDRPRLLAETEEMFRVQHDRFGVDQMSFHVAPATVYLRVHNPGRSGDDVGAARPMVTVANLTHTSQQGLAFSSSTGPGFFGVESFEQLPRLNDIKAILEGPQYAKWQSFRNSDDARSVGLALPRFLGKG